MKRTGQIDLKKKVFLITIDTEGDNLWERATTKKGLRKITTNNAAYIERFQNLCNKFDFYPTYLVNYEMGISTVFQGNACEWIQDNRCEIGMHMHAWNTPPIYRLPYCYKGHNPYAGEYPKDILLEKLKTMTELIYRNFKVAPESHRGGRWYIDQWYIEKLGELGYKVDCSITPGVSWESSVGNNCSGPDYKKYKPEAFLIDGEKNILEIPPTIIKSPMKGIIKNIMKEPYNYESILRKKIWLRPDGSNRKDLLYIVDKMIKSDCDYLEFMLHSLELMPGGSPIFKDSYSIENLYEDLEVLFQKIASHYIGSTLKNYYQKYMNKV